MTKGYLMRLLCYIYSACREVIVLLKNRYTKMDIKNISYIPIDDRHFMILGYQTCICVHNFMVKKILYNTYKLGIISLSCNRICFK